MSKPVILCVDDERIVLNSLKEQLRTKLGNDFHIETSESGQDALELFNELKEERIEVPLIISDYIMPGMKGDELLKLVHRLFPKTVKILLTGQATIEGVTNAINQANLYRYISKPWEQEDLGLAIIEAIKSYDKDKKISEQNRELEQYNSELVKLTDSFVETMVTASDARDTTTAGHSKRLKAYAINLANAINRIDYGKYKDFKFNEEQVRELYYSALLHDIGKIGIGEHVLLKRTRLSDDRQLAIKHKFNYVKLELELKKIQNKINQYEQDAYEKLNDYLSFVLDVSRADFITENEACKIREIAALELTDRVGTPIRLLDDFEVENLVIIRGNLTHQERQAINRHAQYTNDILKHVLWTKGLENVPEIASSHHERLDGSGYYRGLKDDEINIQSRILAILDIFEALISPDRPYKQRKTVNEALEILEAEVKKGHLDGNVFDIFVKEEVYNL